MIFITYIWAGLITAIVFKLAWNNAEDREDEIETNKTIRLIEGRFSEHLRLQIEFNQKVNKRMVDVKSELGNRAMKNETNNLVDYIDKRIGEFEESNRAKVSRAEFENLEDSYRENMMLLKALEEGLGLEFEEEWEDDKNALSIPQVKKYKLVKNGKQKVSKK